MAIRYNSYNNELIFEIWQRNQIIIEKIANEVLLKKDS